MKCGSVFDFADQRLDSIQDDAHRFLEVEYSLGASTYPDNNNSPIQNNHNGRNKQHGSVSIRIHTPTYGIISPSDRWTR